jgi:hypothetical protein
VGVDGARGFARKLQGLAADLRDAIKLTLGERDVTANGGRETLLFAEEVEDVGDRLERIIDFVCDGRCEAADGDEL